MNIFDNIPNGITMIAHVIIPKNTKDVIYRNFTGKKNIDILKHCFPELMHEDGSIPFFRCVISNNDALRLEHVVPVTIFDGKPTILCPISDTSRIIYAASPNRLDKLYLGYIEHSKTAFLDDIDILRAGISLLIDPDKVHYEPKYNNIRLDYVYIEGKNDKGSDD